MKKILHPTATRGTANYGWLQARHSFSFVNYFDPNRLQFDAVKPKSVPNVNNLWIHQQTYFNSNHFSEKTTTYPLQQSSHGIYLVIHGTVIVDNEILNDRDTIGLWDTKSVSITVEKDSSVFLIEIPLN